MLCPPPSAARSRPQPRPTQSPSGEAPTEVVEVRADQVDGVETPTQLLRGGRLWLVRSAEWQPGAARRWRVQAGSGPTAVPVELHLRQHPDGRWSLREPAATASPEPAGWA